MELVLTIDEAARLMRVNRRTIQRNIKNGSIDVIQFGQTVRIPVAQFDGLLDEDAIIALVRDAADADDDVDLS